jgi:membrane protein YqaA with SNARE-associated domain
MDTFLTDHGYFALCLLSFLASTILPIGSEGLLISLLLNHYSAVLTVTVATIGNVLGACTTYAIGLYGGPLLIRKVFRINAESMARTQRLYSRYGSWSLLFTWVPILGDPLCMVSGILKTSFPLFLVLALLGKLARYVFVCWITLAAVA